MKKTVALLSLIALLLSANVVSADRGEKKDNPGRGEEMRASQRSWLKNWKDDRFAVYGKIKSISGSTLVVTAVESKKGGEAVNTDVTVMTDSGTRVSLLGKPIAVSELKVGYLVMVRGELNSSSEKIADRIEVKAEKKTLMGEITAKTSTSVTIKNNVTGVVSTVPVDTDTKVTINGETKTVADVQVGDKGIVKVKSVLETMVTKFLRLFR